MDILEFRYNDKNNPLPDQLERLNIEFARLQKVMSLVEKEGRHEFRLFLESPFFNTNEKLAGLFKKISASRAKKGINAKSLIREFFDSSTDLAQAMKMLTSAIKELRALFFEFLAHYDFKKSGFQYSPQFILGLKQRGAVQLLHEYLGEAIEHEKGTKPTTMSLNHNWWLYHQYYFYQDGKHLEINSQKNEFLKKSNDTLDDFYLLTKLRYHCEYLNRQYNANDGFVLKGLDRLLEWSNDYDGDEAVILLYISCLKLFADYSTKEAILKKEVIIDTGRILDLKARFIAKLSDLALIDQFTLTIFIINLIYRAIEQDAIDDEVEEEQTLALYLEINALHKNAITHNIFTFEQGISDDEFLNIGIIASYVQENSFFDRFVAEYAQKMEAGIREKAVNTVRAFHFFHNEEYEKALALIEKTFPLHSKGSPKYILRVKSLAIRCCLLLYLEDWQMFEALQKSCKRLSDYIDHNDISTQYEEAYQNFIEICTKIYQRKNRDYQVSAAGRAELMAQLNAMDAVVLRRWLATIIKRLR